MCILYKDFNLFMLLLFLQQDQMVRAKVVVALYPFKAIESGDLSLEKVRFDYCVVEVKIQEHLGKLLERYLKFKLSVKVYHKFFLIKDH